MLERYTFNECLYCGYFTKKTLTTNFADYLAEAGLVNYEVMRNHVKEFHPEKLNEFVEKCIELDNKQ